MPPKRAKPIGKQPLYERVRQSIENRVQLGEYSTERPLPSVGALAEEFDVSEITVRRALSDLRNAGVLRAVPSLGTFVHHIEKFVRNLDLSDDLLYGTLDDADYLGRPVGVAFRSTELLNPLISDFKVFDVSDGRHFCVKKIILVDGSPIAFDKTFITYPAPHEILDEFSEDFILRVLRRRKIPIERTNVYFDAAPASAEVASELGIPEGYPTIRNFYNPVLKDSTIRIYGVSESPFDRLGFKLTKIAQDR